MSTVRANSILDSSGGNTATINGMTPTAQSLQGFRNRIINGDMRIDQRNNGASVAPAAGDTFLVDRWVFGASQSSRASFQRSTIAPAGFTNSLLVTSLSAYSVPAGEVFHLQQQIEGFNAADLGWGSASAQAVTLSFWVRSSLTGTFGGAVVNSAVTRSYPFTFTINAANTFEYKTITIPGDTTGTWLTDNGCGIRLLFSLGVGSTRSGTAGAWAAADFRSATGAVSLVGTNGATFYITGVQLEAGSVATPFERRDYGRELIMCQRYFWQIGGSTNSYQIRGAGVSGGAISQTLTFPVAMRSAPTVTIGSVIYANGNGLAFNTNVQQATMGFNTTAAGVDCYVTASGTGFTTFSSEL